MPVNAANIAAQILAAGPKPIGTSFALFAAAVGNGVATWVASGGVTLTGTSSGLSGVGKVKGKYTVVPNALPVAGALTAAGVVGVTAPFIATAVGVGVGTALNTDAIYAGVCGGVGVGVDQVIVVYGDAASLTAALSASMVSIGIVGPTSIQIAAGLASGIAALVSTGTGIDGAVSAPAAGPISSISASTSRLV